MVYHIGIVKHKSKTRERIKPLRLQPDELRRLAPAVVAVILVAVATFTHIMPAHAADFTVASETDLTTALASPDGTINIAVAADFNITKTITIPASKTVNIDGGGHTLTRATSWTTQTSFLSVSAQAAITFENLTLDGNHIDSGPERIKVGNDSTLTLGNNAVLQNFAGHGAISLVQSNGQLILQDNATMRNNDGIASGGAVYCSATATITIGDEAQVVGNTSLLRGGAIHVENGCIVNVSGHAVIKGNTSNNTGGAINAMSDAKVNISDDAVIENNVATAYGGGIFTQDASVTISGNATIAHNAAGRGGGVVLTSTKNVNTPMSLDISGGTFESNTASFYGGGVYVQTNGSPNLRVSVANATFLENSADWGGGAMNLATMTNDTTITNTVFQGNTAGSDPILLGGGAIRFDELSTAELNISNSRFVDNSTTANGGAIGVQYSKLAQINVADSVKFSGNTAATLYKISPNDQALYDTHIAATTWSAPAPLNGYNNYDIQYTGGQETAFCAYNPNYYTDDPLCAEPQPTSPTVPGVPNTGCNNSLTKHRQLVLNHLNNSRLIGNF
jgi:predicted outer membrane repeat protein